jgi:hypothetical protein
MFSQKLQRLASILSEQHSVSKLLKDSFGKGADKLFIVHHQHRDGSAVGLHGVLAARYGSFSFATWEVNRKCAPMTGCTVNRDCPKLSLIWLLISSGDAVTRPATGFTLILFVTPLMPGTVDRTCSALRRVVASSTSPFNVRWASRTATLTVSGRFASLAAACAPIDRAMARRKVLKDEVRIEYQFYQYDWLD